MASWNATRERVRMLGDPTALLLVDVLDCIMDDYAQNEMADIGADARGDLVHDVIAYRRRLTDIVEGHSR